MPGRKTGGLQETEVRLALTVKAAFISTASTGALVLAGLIAAAPAAAQTTIPAQEQPAPPATDVEDVESATQPADPTAAPLDGATAPEEEIVITGLRASPQNPAAAPTEARPGPGEWSLSPAFGPRSRTRSARSAARTRSSARTPPRALPTFRTPTSPGRSSAFRAAPSAAAMAGAARSPSAD